MLNVRLNDNLENRLTKVAMFTDRTKSYITKKALETYLEDIEFFMETKERFEDPNSEYIDFEEFKKKFD